MTSTPSQRSYTPAGLAAAGGTVLAWSAGIVFVKLTTSPVLVVSFWRHGFALPLIALGWLAAGRPALRWKAASIGGALFALHQVLHFSALRYTTTAVVTILFALQPILVASAGGRVTGERATPTFYAWAAVAVAGCAVLVGASSGAAGTSPVGTLFAVANLVAFSAYFLATKRARATVDATSWLLVMTLVSGMIIATLAIVTRAPLTDPSGREWMWLAGIGIIPGSVGHFLITWAHPRIHAAASSTVILVVPVLASIGSWLAVGERFGPLGAAGGVVALAAAWTALRHLPPPVERLEAEVAVAAAEAGG